jgi:hypothetical protein
MDVFIDIIAAVMIAIAVTVFTGMCILLSLGGC